MRFHLSIEISLKPGHGDPEGEATGRLLGELGYKVVTAKVGKIYYIVLNAGSQKEARIIAEEMCKRLLANPTKDDYTITVEEEK